MTPPHTDPSGLLTVGETAARSGVAPSAIRFYERKGLIEAQRTAGNQRRYPAWVPCVVRVARLAQRAGLTVRDIAAALRDIPAAPTPADWARLSEHLVTEAERRIAELQGVLADLHTETKRCELPGR